ncbi:MAG: hypothetical protein KY476_02125 [Planctomycetes bacterium]|nr:hypothetical protein [Planctomycetota bacterium]
MVDNHISRREALRIGGAAVLAGSLPGCGTLASAGRVIIRVAWKAIEKLVSVVVERAREIVLIITAIVEGVKESMRVILTDAQAEELEKGATLILRTEDGTEHELQYELS